jgi:hypothetical protein
VLLSRRGWPVTPGEAHGKEGVNGSSPLEGFEYCALLSGRLQAEGAISARIVSSTLASL